MVVNLGLAITEWSEVFLSPASVTFITNSFTPLTGTFIYTILSACFKTSVVARTLSSPIISNFILELFCASIPKSTPSKASKLS